MFNNAVCTARGPPPREPGPRTAWPEATSASWGRPVKWALASGCAKGAGGQEELPQPLTEVGCAGAGPSPREVVGRVGVPSDIEAGSRTFGPVIPWASLSASGPR